MKLFCGDNVNFLKTLESNSIDSIVTDPPYGLKFMGKKWDHDVPSVEFWKECLRVLKPGGHVLSFGGTRTYHRMAVNIEDAGFEIRDQIQWIYGSGFPKSVNVGKKIESHFGFGTALKPANEPIVLARKPLSEKTIVDNVLKWGTGGLNIDGCRIPTDVDLGRKNKVGANGWKNSSGGNNSMVGVPIENQGRWPANVILDEEAGEMLDEQVKGRMPTPAGNKNKTKIGHGSNVKFNNAVEDIDASRFQLGGDPSKASRFFYCAKASKSERNAGLESLPLKKSGSLGTGEGGGPMLTGSGNERTNLNQNFHPTVKPIKLMEYLIKLVTPPNGTVLDPFMGSGSTGVAAKNLGFDFIGMELDEQYFEIAKKRIGL